MARFRRAALAAAVSGGLGGALLLASAGTALGYGNSAIYQVEISANWTGGSTGAGVWLWIELDADHTGDYTGSDCGHGFEGPGTAGAVADRGDVTWTSDGTTLTIHGVVLNGPGFPVTITVPAAYGHLSTSLAAVFNVPFPGWAQVQVAP
jgi:hypothetical protein